MGVAMSKDETGALAPGAEENFPNYALRGTNRSTSTNLHSDPFGAEASSYGGRPPFPMPIPAGGGIQDAGARKVPQLARAMQEKTRHARRISSESRAGVRLSRSVMLDATKSHRERIRLLTGARDEAAAKTTEALLFERTVDGHVVPPPPGGYMQVHHIIVTEIDETDEEYGNGPPPFSFLVPEEASGCLAQLPFAATRCVDTRETPTPLSVAMGESVRQPEGWANQAMRDLCARPAYRTPLNAYEEIHVHVRRRPRRDPRYSRPTLPALTHRGYRAISYEEALGRCEMLDDNEARAAMYSIMRHAVGVRNACGPREGLNVVRRSRSPSPPGGNQVRTEASTNDPMMEALMAAQRKEILRRRRPTRRWSSETAKSTQMRLPPSLQLLLVPPFRLLVPNTCLGT